MPDQTNPDGPSTPDFGASPEEIQQALNMYRGLNNLDTRGETLQRIVRPDYDGHVLRQIVEPEQPAGDPWDNFAEPEPMGYAADGTPVFAEPPVQYGGYQQPQGFDPRSLQPVFDQYGNQIKNDIFEQLGQMAQEQAFKDSAAQAAGAAGLPPTVAGLIEQRVREAQRMSPNRQIGDIANEVARSVQTELLQWKATPPEGGALGGGAAPAGPVPSTREVPKSFDDYARILKGEMSK